MPDITLVPANLATLVLESFLYGLLLILFISTVYFTATRRTLAGTNQTARHHFTSLVFLGVTALFLIVTVHWSIVIYQTFFAFIHLGSAAAEDAFYADLAEPVEVAKATILFVAILLGDALVVDGKPEDIAGSRMCRYYSRGSKAKTSGNFSHSLETLERGRFCALILSHKNKVGFRLPSDGTYWRSHCAPATTNSELNKWFLSILVESAGLQTFPRLCFTLAAITLFANTDVDFILSDNFPAILGISNTLIHARVGLGWSPNSAVVDHKPQAPVKYPGDAVCWSRINDKSARQRRGYVPKNQPQSVDMDDGCTIQSYLVAAAGDSQGEVPYVAPSGG
ncbi:hypothetical protein B0H13DRAFT_1874939 [Mycena leptocephala]|nr:hypothetical protein B0H13DRAFT_1874939 [Mycena leptocephala]